MTAAEINQYADAVLEAAPIGVDYTTLMAVKLMSELFDVSADEVSVDCLAATATTFGEGSVYINSPEMDLLLIPECGEVERDRERVQLGMSGADDDEPVWVSAGTLHSAMQAAWADAQSRAEYWTRVAGNFDRRLLPW